MELTENADVCIQLYRSDEQGSPDENMRQPVRRLATLNEILQTYKGSFTVHGLSRVFNGTITERILWIIALLGSFTIICLVLLDLTKKYSRKDVYVDTLIKNDLRIDFPTVTICANLEKDDKYCGNKLGRSQLRFAECNWKREYPKTLKMTKLSSVGDSMMLSNDDFIIETKDPLFTLNPTVMMTLFQIANVSRGICITFNSKGSFYTFRHKVQFFLYVQKQHALNYFGKYKKAFILDMVVHNPDEFGILGKKKTYTLVTGYNHKVMLTKTRYKRLPSPFPSNCVKDGNNNTFLTGSYSMPACQETQRCLLALNITGDTFDHCKDFLPESILQKYKRTAPLSDIRDALFAQMPQFDKNKDKCFSPCDAIVHDVRLSRYLDPDQEFTYAYGVNIEIEYTNGVTYKEISENELYSFTQLLGESGGIIGMMIGMSILSIIEIFVFLLISILNKVLGRIKK